MKISYVSVSRVSKILALSLALGVSSVAFAADNMSAQEIVDRIKTNNASRISEQNTLAFKPVEFTKFEGDKIKVASSRNLGHLLMELREQFHADLGWLNELQTLATDPKSEFLPKVMEQAYSAFKWIYNLSVTDKEGDTLTRKSLEAARQSWLLNTLVDYGIVSATYRQIFLSTEATYKTKNDDETAKLSVKLTASKDSKEKERTTENEKHTDNEKKLTDQKAHLEGVLAEETNSVRKKETGVEIKKLEGQLEELAKEHALYNAKIDADIAMLESDFASAKDKMAAEMNNALSDLQEKYGYIFEKMGNSFGIKTAARLFSSRPTVRSAYPEFDQLNKLLSNVYPHLVSQSRNSALDELFSKVTSKDETGIKEALRRSAVLKGLLGISDEEYGEITKRIHARDVAKNAELTAKATEGQAQIQQAIVASIVPAAITDLTPKPVLATPTPEEAAAAARAADYTGSKLAEKKKGANELGTPKEPEASVAVAPEAAAPVVGDYRLAAVTGAANVWGIRNRFPQPAAIDAPSSQFAAAAVSNATSPVTSGSSAGSTSASSSAQGAQKKNQGKGGRRHH